MLSARNLLALWLVTMIMIAVFSNTARAEDAEEDDDDDTGAGAGGAGDDFGAEGGQKPLGFGLGAIAVFPKNGDLKVAAGEKVETLIVINNVASNPEYTAVFVAAHLSPLNDFNRYYQNFSGNAYKRVIPAGQQTTLKYSFTPDVNAEPMDFSLVVRVFIQPSGEENQTFAIAAYNSTFTIGEPLGTDPKSVFTVLLFGGIIAAVVYYNMNGDGKKSSSASTGAGASSSGAGASSGRSAPAESVEIRKGVTVEKDFLPDAHKKYLDSLAKRGGRANSPRQ